MHETDAYHSMELYDHSLSLSFNYTLVNKDVHSTAQLLSNVYLYPFLIMHTCTHSLVLRPKVMVIGLGVRLVHIGNHTQ